MDWIGMLLGWTGGVLIALKPRVSKFYGFQFYILANFAWIGWSSAQPEVVWSIIGQSVVYTAIAILGVWNHRKDDDG